MKYGDTVHIVGGFYAGLSGTLTKEISDGRVEVTVPISLMPGSRDVERLLWICPSDLRSDTPSSRLQYAEYEGGKLKFAVYSPDSKYTVRHGMDRYCVLFLEGTQNVRR